MADVAAVDTALASDSADDRTGLDAVLLANLDAVARTGAGGRTAATAAARAVRPALERAVLVAARLEGGAHELAGLVELFLAADLSVSAAILLVAGRRALVAHGRGQQGRGDVLDAHVLTHVGQQALVHVEAAALDAGGQALEESAGTELRDGGGRGNLDLFHLGARQLLDAAQTAVLTRGEEGQRATLAPGAAGAADTVHVGLGLAGNVEVNHQRNALHVQAARGHVGGDQHVERAVLQALNHALTLGLGDVAGNASGAEAAAGQLEGHLFDVGAGAHEHDGRVGLLLAGRDVLGAGSQDAGQGTDLVLVGHDRVGLVNRVDRRRLRGDGDLDGILQVLAGDLFDGGRHRRAEQGRQAIIRGARRDRLDVLSKAHAQHFVGLVEDQHAHVRQVQRTLLDEVDDAARGADDDLGAALEGADLRAVRRAAVDGDDVEAGSAGREILDRLGALHGELTGGGQDQGLDVALIGIDDGQQRQAEGGRLAGARLGDADDVAQLQQRRDGSCLDRGGDAEAHVGDGLEDLLGQAEARESHGVVVCVVSVLGIVEVGVFVHDVVDEAVVLVRIDDVVALVLFVAVHVVLRGHSDSLPVACGVAKPSGRAISAPQRGLTHNNKSRIPRGTITRGCASSLPPA